MAPSVGGVVLFASNCNAVKQVQTLVRGIQNLREPKLLIAIDQEGGRVQRLKEGVTILPPQAKIGKLFDNHADSGLEMAELVGYLMAREMRQCGIDISFSPVLDVVSVESNVIGDRSFHHDPFVVSKLADAWIRGMQKAGMKAVGKHFPGHGGVSSDSHLEVPEDKREIKTVLDCDLFPYRRLGERLSAVMSAHVWYSEVTSAIPTYSTFWLEHILREVLAFYGPVFSDDLTMAGAADAGDMETRVLTALSSGCDFALICNDSGSADTAIEALNKETDAWHPPSWQHDYLQPKLVEFTEAIEPLQDRLAKILSSL